MDAIGFAEAPAPHARWRGRGETGSVQVQGNNLSSLWRGVLSGLLIVAVGPELVSTVAITLCQSTAPSGAPCSDADRVVFDEVIRGKQQKVVALELDRSASTVAGQLRRVVDSMGLSCNFTRLPLAIPLLAHAARFPELVETYVECERSSGDPASFFLRLRLCEQRLLRLSKSEAEVAHQLLRGLSHAEIADRRATSRRTVANQIASVYAKTGASGRYDLLRMMVEDWCLTATNVVEQAWLERPGAQSNAFRRFSSRPAQDMDPASRAKSRVA